MSSHPRFDKSPRINRYTFPEADRRDVDVRKGNPSRDHRLNKAIPDRERDYVFAINADREFAERKKQIQPRPEDIEKFARVFESRIEEVKIL